MKPLRIGTRGSDLALWQTNWVTERLKAAKPGLEIIRVIIKTHGDLATQQKFDANWPVGGFVGAIEQAISNKEVDLAVHSYKDLQTATTPGLTISAIPIREVVYDTLVTREPVDLYHLPKGFRIGTSSPRRAAQFRQLGDVEIVEIRGNVPTRVAKLQTEELDGVVLAGAGIKRLSIETPNRIDLPTDKFVPAPAQGALAIQTRDHGEARDIVKLLDDAPTRKTVTAERAFLRQIGGGCHVPVGALAKLNGLTIELHGQLFSDDGSRMATGIETGQDAEAVGIVLADRLVRQLR